MKRNKKTCPLSGIRSEWKDEIGDELDKFKEGITSSKFTPEIEAAMFEMVRKLRIEINEKIEGLIVTPQIAADQKDFTEDFLFDIWVGKVPVDEYDLDKMRDTVCEQTSSVFIKAESLAEKIKVEDFIQELKENPYQLKMAI
jgi:hypothetical protein